MNRRTVALVATLGVLGIAAFGWTVARTSSADPASSREDVAACALATLPPEASDTVRTIHRDGPFPFPRNDGVVFGNREGHLPPQAKGYYHEYTVATPGARNRSTRRIVTGGAPLSDPPQIFYTGDHYDSFCLVSDADRARDRP